ncbi:hypothetical protein O6H91_04G077200 [Diphasiastrum complanatum]|uniref:Uncharacterized protein n=1 Tax=Diphasiastrum complanatum TaxID=34168 RepID=A0ACC2DYF1_DIPCM|nr:hypothetical protein O6H91_04G077200 [Diphasiastrum complanatum]
MADPVVRYMSQILMEDELDEDGSMFNPCHSIQAVEQELADLLTDSSSNEFFNQSSGYAGSDGKAHVCAQPWEINSKNWADNLRRELQIEEDYSNASLSESYASSGSLISSPGITYLDLCIDEERKSLEQWYDSKIPVSPYNTPTDQLLHFRGLSLSSPMGSYGTSWQASIGDLSSPPAVAFHAQNSPGLRSNMNTAYMQQSSYSIDRNKFLRHH